VIEATISYKFSYEDKDSESILCESKIKGKFEVQEGIIEVTDSNLNLLIYIQSSGYNDKINK